MKELCIIAAALAVIGSAGLYAYKTSLEWKADDVRAEVAKCRLYERSQEKYTAEQSPLVNKMLVDAVAECRKKYDL